MLYYRTLIIVYLSHTLFDAENMGKVAVIYFMTLVAVVTTDLTISRPENFYGSDALLDGYCDDAQHFIVEGK